MLRTDLMIRPHDRPLEEREGPLDAVGMNVTAHVLFRRVVHGLVLSVLILDALVGLKVVRVDLLGIRGMLFYESVERLAVPSLLDNQADTAATLQGSQDHSLVSLVSTSHALNTTSDKGLIDFDCPFERFDVGVFQGRTDAMTKVPRRLVGDLENPLELVGRDALARLGHHVDGGEPLPKRQVGVMEDRSSLDGELVTA